MDTTKFHRDATPCEKYGTPHDCYVCACASASELQHTTEIALALEAAGYPCRIAQTGGLCMLVIVPCGAGEIGVNEECAVYYAKGYGADEGRDEDFKEIADFSATDVPGIVAAVVAYVKSVREFEAVPLVARVAEQLAKLGVPATYEFPGFICISITGSERCWNIGTQAEEGKPETEWTGELTEDGHEVAAIAFSHPENPEQIAKLIKEAVRG